MNRRIGLIACLLLLFAPIAGHAGLAGGSDGRLDYVAFGASDATGIGALPLNEGYVFQIRDALAARGPVRLLNFGIPGATIERIEDAVELFLISGQDADIITLWTGPNDVTQGVDVDDFEEALEEILGQLRAESDAPIVIANVPNLTRLPRYLRVPDEDVTLTRVYAFNQAIQRQAIEFDVPVIDLFAILNLPGNLISDIDGFHPNNAGHQRIAQLFLNVILSGM